MFDTATKSSKELSITRIMDVPREKLFRAWLDAATMHHWFCPKPWTVENVQIDARPGGGNSFVMKGPNGEVFPNRGQYLEIVENEKIVFTDAYVGDWVPSDKPFFTAILTFEDIGDGKTRYVARALHWSDEDRETHEKMGFEEGWGIVAGQLEAFVKTL